MPELPEVETVSRSLVAGQNAEGGILNRKIVRAKVDWNKTIAQPSVATFKRKIKGQSVIGVGRRGKFIRIDLSSDTLLIHLRMSGDILLGRDKEDLGKYARLLLIFEDGLQLSFNDARKFGRVWLLKVPEEVLGALGPDPLDPSFSSIDFFENLHARKRQLKPLLLDQSFLAGVGNIYADEALYAARLHPLSSAHSLSKKESDALFFAIRSVLEEGIRRNGASIDWVYRGGEYQNHFSVYQKTGQPCQRCGNEIERLLVGQRGTHICPNCQTMKN